MTRAARRRGLAVAIVGAGPAGSATALRLGRLGAGPVLLAEAGDFAGFRIGESLPPIAGPLLAELGVLPALLAQDHERCLGSCASWGDDRPSYHDFLTHPAGAGWHLDRGRFDRLLAAEAARSGARLETGWRLAAAERRTAGGWRLSFRTAAGRVRRVDADLVVDASGQRAAFARLAGGRRHFADRLVAIAGRFELAAGAALGRLTMLEGCPYGWWYAARLAGGRALVSLTTDPATAGRRQLRQPLAWLCHLAGTHLGAGLDGSRLAGELQVFPAASCRLAPAAGEDWLAVGDAAAAFDPLTSQGIHKALAGGLAAGDAITRRLAGAGAEEFAAYAAGLERAWAAYAAARAQLYAREMRWPEQPFWRARRPAAD